MLTRLLISIGAGLAGAVFFMVPMKGAMSAGLTMLFAPLPLMVAGLAFAPSSALTGMVAGALLIWAFIHEYYAVFFLAWAGLPAWWLTRLAWLARPATESEKGDETGLVWYPVGGLVFWSALLGAGVAAALLLAGTIYLGGFEGFVAQMTRSLTAILEGPLKSPSGPKLPADMTVQDIARYATYAMPAVLAGWATFSYAANMWIAGRVNLISQGMKRPWLDIPENLRMPRSALGILAGSFLLCAIEGLPRALGVIGMAALLSAFALQGFALVHWLLRGSQARAMLLTAIYLATAFLFPAPPVLAALFGLAYALASGTRGRPQTPPNPNT